MTPVTAATLLALTLTETPPVLAKRTRMGGQPYGLSVTILFMIPS
jgi:hypothetical protein